MGRILVADDEDDVRFSLERRMKRDGHHVTIAGSQAEASQCIEDAVVHLYEAEEGEVRQSNSPTYFDHFAFDCTELEAAEEALTKVGVEYHKSVIPLTGQRQVFLVDPAGNRVELNFGTSAS